MIVITDELGEWYQLGLVKPVDYNRWYDLTPVHDIHSGRYRFSFACDKFNLISSYGWVRSVYVKEGKELYSQSRRVYPHPVSLDIPMPIPKELLTIGINRQKLQLKKLLRYRRSTDFLWSVKIEELYIEGQQSEKTFSINLSNVVSAIQHPDYPDLYITTFEEVTGFATYEVGRFYSLSGQLITSDPIVETYPNRLRVIFTGKQVVLPNSFQVKIVA